LSRQGHYFPLNVTPYGYNIGRAAHNWVLQRLISGNLHGLKVWMANGFQVELVFLFYIGLVAVTYLHGSRRESRTLYQVSRLKYYVLFLSYLS